MLNSLALKWITFEALNIYNVIFNVHNFKRMGLFGKKSN